MQVPRRSSTWLLIFLAAALVAAMLWTMVGLSRGDITSKHGVHGALLPALTPVATRALLG